MINIAKNILDNIKQSATDAFNNTSKRAIQKTAEASGNLIGIKISGRITKISKISQQNNSETAANENNREIPKERYISPGERQKVTDDRRLI